MHVYTYRHDGGDGENELHDHDCHRDHRNDHHHNRDHDRRNDHVIMIVVVMVAIMVVVMVMIMVIMVAMTMVMINPESVSFLLIEFRIILSPTDRIQNHIDSY